MMTVNELYRSLLKELSGLYSIDEAANICTMIFESVAGINRSALRKDPNLILDESTTNKIMECLDALKGNKPIQYILGEAWFYELKFNVSPGVLIPRPETEELVEAVILSLRDKPGTNLIDIGTGSGCIAIAIKKNLPAVLITAIDISDAALKIAKENAALHHTEINFVQIDFLAEKSRERLEKYDVIVSNPPYIPRNELLKMDKNVTAFEPHTALFVEIDKPLIFYENIVYFAKAHLKENGKIFMETHEDFADAVGAIFNSNEYNTVIRKDLSGKQRMVIATRCR